MKRIYYLQELWIESLTPLAKKGAAKAPYGSHRFNLSAGAARLFPTYRGRATGFDLHFLYPKPTIASIL